MQSQFRGRGLNCRYCGVRLRPWNSLFCSEDCYQAGSEDSLQKRFWAKVDKSGECWTWTANKLPTGYGMFDRDYAHRVSYTLAYGEIPKGMIVRHLCNKPPCVRPDHLEIGSQWKNVQDARSQGHMGASMPRNRTYSKDHPRGERSGGARLNEDKVREIRRLYALGETPMKTLAAMFDVHYTTISQVVRGNNWQQTVA